MLDHLGLTSADLARSKTFFLQALAPLQIGVVMEVTAEQTLFKHFLKSSSSFSKIMQK